jgi:seryl-tRNA synthetase
MLDIKYIRDNPDFVAERLKIKNFYNPEKTIEQILKLYEERKSEQQKNESYLFQRKNESEAIRHFLKNREEKEAELRKTKVGDLNSSIKLGEEKIEYLSKNLDELLLTLPNLPSDKVPPGKTPADNVLVKEGGNKPQLPKEALPHWELIKKYDIVDFETGAKITGSGFPLYKGKGAKLQRALIQYFLDFNTKAGYTEYLPPLMVNEASARGTGQLPDKEGQMYFMPADNYYMIPTSEVPLTNIYRDEIVKETDLPIKMTGFSPCFRREAGSFGADVRGLNRVHQFDKVEIVQIVQPDKSYTAHEEMVTHVEQLLQTLGLPYRILALCGGDMSFASALTYDFEVFSAAQQKWLEVSSVSNFETFQTNRMKIRFKDGKGKMQLAHSLNGSSLALPRIVACILENNQSASGIELPPALHTYFGDTVIS